MGKNKNIKPVGLKGLASCCLALLPCFGAYAQDSTIIGTKPAADSSAKQVKPVAMDSTLYYIDTSFYKPLPKDGFWNSKAVNISIAPLSLFAASGLTWGLRPEVRKLRNRYIPTFNHHYDDYLQYAPAAAVFGLNALGVKGKHSIKRATVSYLFSFVTMGILVNGVKYTAKVERPDGSANNSYPSGHTATTFMNATFLHKEYGQYRHPLYSIGAYTVGATIGVSRQLNNRHWISDVLAGAGIGILSTEIGYIIADKVFKDKGTSPSLRRNFTPITKKPSFMEVRLGMAIATSKDLTAKSEDLLAKRGFNMGIEGAWFFHKNVGIGGEFAFSSFPMNDDNLKFDDPDIPVVSSGHYTQPMGLRYLHVGPFFSVPLPQNWFITGKLVAGSSVGSQGNIMLQLNPDYEDIFGTKEFPYLRYKPEVAFSWSAGAGIQKRVGRNVAIKAYATYFNSRHDFDIDRIDDIATDGKYVYKNIGSEKVSFNHLAFGLAATAFLW